jgi:transposase
LCPPRTAAAPSLIWTEQLLRELVEAQNDATLAEYADAYEKRTGRRYSSARLCTALKEMHLSRKGRRSARRSN